jgi:3-hydroxyacyl-[acyl-carrier-protein] dehydratase
MILSGDFYTIRSMQTEGNMVSAELELNALHQIFEGHFPGMPIVPGVCQMQMVKEILEIVLARETRLVRASNMKFLAVINPVENAVVQLSLQFDITDAGYKVVSSIASAVAVHFKFQGLFK